MSATPAIKIMDIAARFIAKTDRIGITHAKEISEAMDVARLQLVDLLDSAAELIDADNQHTFHRMPAAFARLQRAVATLRKPA